MKKINFKLDWKASTFKDFLGVEDKDFEEVKGLFLEVVSKNYSDKRKEFTYLLEKVKEKDKNFLVFALYFLMDYYKYYTAEVIKMASAFAVEMLEPDDSIFNIYEALKNIDKKKIN